MKQISTYRAILRSGKWISQRRTWSEFLNSQLFFLLVIEFFLTVTFVILFTLGFNTSLHTYFNLDQYRQHVSYNIELWRRTIRSIGIFVLAWIIVLYLFIIYKFPLLVYKWLQVLIYFVFFPPINLWLLVWFAKNSQNKVTYFKSLFASDPLLVRNEYRRHWTYKLVIVSFLLTSPYIGLTWINASLSPTTVASSAFHTFYDDNLWFNSFMFFTVQSNYMCWFLLLFYIINPIWKIFRGQTVFCWFLTYITVVSLVYNFCLMPFAAATLAHNSNVAFSSLWILCGIYAHCFNPIVYITTVLLLIKKCSVKLTNDWGFTVKFGLIYPAIYLFFLVLSNFLTGVSVYGIFTNLDPYLIIWGENGQNNTSGNPVFVLFYLLIAILLVSSMHFYWLFIFCCTAKKNGIKLTRENSIVLQSIKYQLNKLTHW